MIKENEIEILKAQLAALYLCFRAGIACYDEVLRLSVLLDQQLNGYPEVAAV